MMKAFRMTVSSLVLAAMAVLPAHAGSQGQYPAYSGNKRMAVIMLAWQDKPSPATRQSVVNKIWNNNQSLRKYYLDMSRGLFEFVLPADADPDGTVPESTSDVYGPYVLSVAEGFSQDVTYANVESLYGIPGYYALSGTHSVARNLAADRDGFRAQDYDYIMYVTPKGPSTGSVGGYANYNSTESHLYELKQNFINHELGHNFGLSHSNTSVDQDGYGSQDCVMGNQNNPHLDSVHTYNLGWYPDVSFGMKTYGQYTIENLAQPDTDSLKVLRFDREAHGATYKSNYNIWVSYRVKGIGHDSSLNRSWDDKVNIHLCVGASMRPGDPWGDPRDVINKYAYPNNNVSKFLAGGSYTDFDSVCRVKFLRKETSTNASAVIQLIDPNGNQPPSIPAQTVYVSLGTTNFTLLANDPESDTLTFEIVNAPDEGTLDVAGGTFTYTVTNAGSYSFTARVNDGQYDSVDRVISVEVVGVTPPTVDAGPDQAAIVGDLSWSPNELSLGAWYDAADALTISESSGSVNQLDDKSGNGNHLSANGNPTTGSRMINGVNVIDFDGSGDELVATSLSPLNTENISLFSVQQHDQLDVQSMTAWTLERNSDRDGMLFHSSYNSSFSLGQRWPVNASVGYTENTNIELISYVKSGVSSQAGWADGVSIGQQTGSVTSFTPQKLVLGSRSGGNYLNGAIGEYIIVSGALSADDRQKMEGYLAHKWGLATNLPLNHPYKGAVPGGTMAVVTLNGLVDDADGDQLISTWSLLSGPDSVRFTDSSSTDTLAYFLTAGVYVLRLTTTDGLTPVSDDVTITITDDVDPTTVNGTPHAWFQGYGITNNFEDADLADLDLDGALAWQEYLAGTDPTDPASVFCIMQSQLQGSGSELTWYGTIDSGVTSDFLIFRCTNLVENIWTQVGSQARHASGTNTWMDAGFAGNAPVYYRVVIVQ